jgi:hypothetical protein
MQSPSTVPSASNIPVLVSFERRRPVALRGAVQAGTVWERYQADEVPGLRPAEMVTWAQAQPGQTFALLVERPALAMARALGADDTLAPADVLSGWLHAASALRDVLRRQRQCTKVFDADELRLMTADGMTASTDSLLRLAAAAAVQAQPEQGLLLALCEPLLGTDPQAMAVFEELHAACEVLDIPFGALNGHATVTALDAVTQLQQLRREWRAGQEVSPRLAQVNATAERLSLELEDARKALADAQKEELAQRTEVQQLVAQLHQTQEELARAWVAQQAASNQAQQLSEQVRTAAAAEEERHALQAQVDDDAQALEGLKSQLAGLQNLPTQLRDSQAESEALLLQLHQTQEELERLWLAQQAAQAEARQVAERTQAAATAAAEERRVLQTQAQERDARASQQLAQSEAARAALQARVDAEARSLTALRADLDALRKAHAAEQSTSQQLRKDLGESRVAASQVPALTQQLGEARTNIGLQEEQINTLHEELLHHYLLLKTYETSPVPLAPVSAPPPILTDATTTALVAPGHHITRGSSHQDPLHAHVEFTLTRAHPATEQSEQVRLRLLEHRGRPGLALLREAGQAAPLGHWIEHGREADRSYMLLIPEDSQGLQALQQLPSSDWLFVCRLAQELRDLLSPPADAESAHWRAVAAKLHVMLTQLPARLRYDGLTVGAGGPDAGADVVAITLHHVAFGSQTLERLDLHWQPGGPFDEAGGLTALALLLPPDAGDATPPFAGWPLQPEGGWARRWVLPVGRGLGGSALRSRWTALSEGDRALVLALLDALPAACRQRQGWPNPTAWPEEAAVREAQGLFKQARLAVRTHELRRGLRRLLRR